MWQEFEKLTIGSTHKTIYQPDAARLCICVPPKHEQEAIVSYILRQVANIDVATARMEIAVQRLQEYRRALISATVTGKVREHNRSSSTTFIAAPGRRR